MRKQGNSYAQISKKLGVSQSTAYLWTKEVVLDRTAQELIGIRKDMGRQKGVLVQKRLGLKAYEALKLKISSELTPLAISPVFAKILCAFLYWGEGGKTDREVRFTNSDPELVATFLELFRSAFSLNEAKFRVVVHLHAYHQQDQELDFWSKVANVPLSQFYKVYRKASTGKYKKENYHGCISIRYHDVMVWQEIQEVYKQFSQKIQGRIV